MDAEEIILNGEIYVKKSSQKLTENVMIRTYSAGVFYGVLKSKEYTQAGTIVVLENARRVWKWTGAASLSQLAQEGTSDPGNCMFPCKVSQVELTAIEIIPITEQAYKTLEEVQIWTK